MRKGNNGSRLTSGWAAKRGLTTGYKDRHGGLSLRLMEPNGRTTD